MIDGIHFLPAARVQELVSCLLLLPCFIKVLITTRVDLRALFETTSAGPTEARSWSGGCGVTPHWQDVAPPDGFFLRMTVPTDPAGGVEELLTSRALPIPVEELLRKACGGLYPVARQMLALLDGEPGLPPDALLSRLQACHVLDAEYARIVAEASRTTSDVWRYVLRCIATKELTLTECMQCVSLLGPRDIRAELARVLAVLEPVLAGPYEPYCSEFRDWLLARSGLELPAVHKVTDQALAWVVKGLYTPGECPPAVDALLNAYAGCVCAPQVSHRILETCASCRGCVCDS